MSSLVEVSAIVEGQTEAKFFKEVLAPYLGDRYVFVRGIIASKPGQKGGNIHFERVKKDIDRQLKQRSDIYATQFIDFYGIHDWPEYAAIRKIASAHRKGRKVLCRHPGKTATCSPRA